MGLRGTSLAVGAGLLAIGLLAASPFLSRGLVGSGEAYNYSLSVADAVSQMRRGVIPPLVGQTEYAFNGRIHPLRNAPYLHYLAGAIDVATLRRLSFWELQNTSLALSLVAAVFACYLGLRWGTGCRPLAAFLLSAAYGLCAPLLSAAHQGDLFMTVHAAVFVPLAVAACLKGCRQPSFPTDAWLAAALAATWLAHPPVAFWLTAGVALVRVLAFLRRPSRGILRSALGAAIIGFALAGFGFASAATLNADLGFFSQPNVLRGAFADVIMSSLRSALPGALLPVSRGAGELADIQLGYVPWALLLLTCALLLRRGRGPGGGPAEDRFAAGATVLVNLLILGLMFPVPFITRWLWQRMPGVVLELISVWPMQRLYLVAAAFAVFGAGLVLPGWLRGLRRTRWAAAAAIAAGSLWTLYEAEPFIARGFRSRWTLEATRSAFRPSNIDLTITSYAFVGLPPTFNYGVIDPQFEFRILRDGKDELSSNLSRALATAPVVGRGELRTGVDPAVPGRAVSGKLALAPGHRYLLTFAFRGPPATGVMQIVGPMIRRTYALPSAGQAKGFGMLGGQRRSVPIWTDSDSPETVEVWFDRTDGPGAAGAPAVFADYTLQDVDLGALPVRMDGLLPLRFSADAPEAGCTVETPRRFLAGYEATVNGAPVTPVISPYRQVMVPVPRGPSVVELRYAGPRLARAAFWLCAASWIGFFAWAAAGPGTLGPPLAAVRRRARGLAGLARRRKAISAGALFVVMGAAALGVWHRERQAYLRGVGPLRIDFMLPYGMKGVSQPLLATGRKDAGVVVFVTRMDSSRIRLGADVWGNLFQSAPIEVDPFRVQTLVVSDSALYPPGHPVVRALDPAFAERLRGELRVELNGTTAIAEKAYGFESSLSEIHVGGTRIGSLTGPEFLGRIVSTGRLPVPQELVLPRGRQALLRVRFPGARAGAIEPLLSALCDADELTLCAHYLPGGRLRLATVGAGGFLTQSEELGVDPALSHDLVVRPDEAPGGSHYFGLACSLDGASVLGRPNPAAPNAPSLLRSGINTFSAPGVDARFTGPEMDLAAVPGRAGAATAWGPLHLVVTFPQGKSGRHEPLLTSGRTGAGDFIYVVYEDGRHVRIGFDHWGGAGALSEPIPADYGAPHELLIRTGALYPELSDNGAWGAVEPEIRSAFKSRVSVILDGKTVLESATPAHPSPPGAVTVARNAIGGSTADPEFSGKLKLDERMGPGFSP